ETADVESSVTKSLTGAFAYSGQVCISVQRIFIHEKRFDEWTERFVKGARGLKKGDPADESTELGVMIDEEAAKRAESWIKEAADNKAEILCGGKRDGQMLDATVLTTSTHEMRVVAAEVFAPVAVVD